MFSWLNCVVHVVIIFFFFNYTATTEIYTYLHTLSLHDALPIFGRQPVGETAARGAGADDHVVESAGVLPVLSFGHSRVPVLCRISSARTIALPGCNESIRRDRRNIAWHGAAST